MSLVEMQQDQYLAMFTSSIKLLTVSLFHFHSVLREKKDNLNYSVMIISFSKYPIP